MAKIIKRVEFSYEHDGETGTVRRRACDGMNTLELLGLLTLERERLLCEMFDVPQIDAEFESEVKPDAAE